MRYALAAIENATLTERIDFVTDTLSEEFPDDQVVEWQDRNDSEIIYFQVRRKPDGRKFTQAVTATSLINVYVLTTVPRHIATQIRHQMREVPL